MTNDLLENLDSLTAIAEVGAALAGFATLAGILRRDYADRNIAFGVVETSLIAVVFALLPAAVGSVRVPAALFFLVWTIAWTHATYRQRRFAGSISGGHTLLAVATLPIPIVGSALALLTAIGMSPEHGGRFYACALLCPVVISCVLLWMTVRAMSFTPDGSASA